MREICAKKDYNKLKSLYVYQGINVHALGGLSSPSKIFIDVKYVIHRYLLQLRVENPALYRGSSYFDRKWTIFATNGVI